MYSVNIKSVPIYLRLGNGLDGIFIFVLLVLTVVLSINTGGWGCVGFAGGLSLIVLFVLVVFVGLFLWILYRKLSRTITRPKFVSISNTKYEIAEVFLV